jgi:hypothetical protein
MSIRMKEGNKCTSESISLIKVHDLTYKHQLDATAFTESLVLNHLLKQYDAYMGAYVHY